MKERICSYVSKWNLSTKYQHLHLKLKRQVFHSSCISPQTMGRHGQNSKINPKAKSF